MSSSSPVSAVPATAPRPHVVDDFLGIVQLHSDGTVTRSADYSALPLKGDVPSSLPVQWKDVVYDAAHALRLRMYRPTATRRRRRTTANCRCWSTSTAVASASAASSCRTSTPARSASPPSSRRSCSPPTTAWRPSTASPRRTATPRPSCRGSAPRPTRGSPTTTWPTCAGCSSAATRLAARYGSGQLAALLDPVVVRLAGCVLLYPYFGAEERTASETGGLVPDQRQFMGTALADQAWRLALPVGATRDHPAANPFGPESAPLDDVAFPPLLVVDPVQDVLHDRIQDYAARLTAMGKPVELVVFRGQGHGFFSFDPCGEASDQLIHAIRRFVHGGLLPA